MFRSRCCTSTINIIPPASIPVETSKLKLTHQLVHIGIHSEKTHTQVATRVGRLQHEMYEYMISGGRETHTKS